MLSTRLDGKRVLLTQSREFMGPALVETFQALGAHVIADEHSLDQDPLVPQNIVQAAGQVDVLLLHLALPAPSTPVGEIDDAEWRNVFAHLVDPMPRLVAAALRGQKRTGSYSAARGAQLAYVQAVGLELATYGIQFNAIAQNFVVNPTYYGAEVQANPRFQDRLKRDVPLGRLVSAQEDANYAGYLCSDAAACFVGQIFPISGGWASR